MTPSLSRAITTIFFVLLLVVHISAYLSLIGRLAYCRRASESSNVNDATSRERVRRFGIWWPRPSHPSKRECNTYRSILCNAPTIPPSTPPPLPPSSRKRSQFRKKVMTL
ncbi:unnamed protein product [Porites evermanni]|uniref:Secreted protein n=1 Tax=Porites evermanni TaxID=104178 RepID=A0ABN8LKI4_9CNID|nr:unnamed protein product [Porites evermanni]